jgi:regulator of protease activity HflC (stomatin/prohibitin superfamily)
MDGRNVAFSNHAETEADMADVTPMNRTIPGLPNFRGLGGFATGVFMLAAILVSLPLFVWFGCRIEPRADEIAVLVRKTGKDLPSGQIIATDPEQKGIQLKVLAEGRYFKNPYTWGWSTHKITDIPAGRLGVKVRLFGDDLPPGQIIAQDGTDGIGGTKGIIAEVLRPGKYRINPFAYRAEQFDAITVRPGHVGVMISLVGDDVLNNSQLSPEQRNDFLVSASMKGVIPEVVDPGTYYLNPYMVNLVEVNLQSQRFEMSGLDVISFLTLDGFTVIVEGTIEFAFERDKVAQLTHRVGDMDDITQKIILPRARGFSRLEGSKNPAISYIVGETRQKFQNELESHLHLKCIDWGVDVKSVLIRKIVVPDAIASISRDREIAVQDAKKFEQQIEQARSKAELVKQEMLALQNKEQVESETERIRAVISAEQGQEVMVIAAQKDLGVAKLELAAAEHQAAAVILRAEGQKDAILAKNEAEASVLAGEVKAFESGINLARYRFYERIGPKIKSVLSGDQIEGLGSIFSPFLPKGKEVPK